MYIYKKYLILFCVFFAFLSAPLLGNYLILKNTKDNLSVSEVIELQTNNAHFTLYSPVSEVYFRYKLYLYQKIKPDIVALGSSRVMQFRENFFTKKFVNLGGMAKNTDDIENAIISIISIKKPELMIIGLDFWWFHADEKKRPLYCSDNFLEKPALFNTLTKPYKWLLNGSIKLSDYINFLQASPTDNIGIQSIINNEGFARDGSYYYPESFIKNNIKNIQKMDANIKVGTNYYFRWGNKLSEHAKNKLASIEALLCKENIKHIYFIPPIDLSVSKKMDEYSKEYQYVKDLFSYLLTMNIPSINYHYLDGINTSSYEFVDAFHGGDLLYAKLLLDMDLKYPIRGAINYEYLKNITENYQDISMLPNKLMLRS